MFHLDVNAKNSKVLVTTWFSGIPTSLLSNST